MTTGDHFRSSDRPRLACRVEFVRATDTSATRLSGQTSDIGVGGLRLTTEENLTLGERIEVILPTPTTWEPLQLTAEVCWVGQDEVRLRFLGLTEKQLILMSQFVDALKFEN